MKELGRIAREADSPRDDAEARELLRPFTPEEVREMAENAVKTALGDAPKPAAAGAENENAKPAAVGPAEARARARWGGRSLAIGAFVVAAAAAALLWSRTTPPPDALASYELVVEGSQRATRSGEPTRATEPVRVARDGRLVILARPRVRVPAGVRAVVRIAHGDALTAWKVVPEISAEGAVRVEAGPSALAELPDGASQLVVFVARADLLPTTDDAARAARRSAPEGVRVLERSIDVAPR